MTMDNNSAYSGILLAGIHTLAYNNVKSRGFVRANDESGGKMDMMNVLICANAYVFDIDACKV